MRFEWDENKRRANRRKHGLDFIDVPKVFDGFTFTFEDDRFEYGEQRYLTMGMFRQMVVVIAHTEYQETIRIISMRKATAHEKKIYFQNFQDRLGSAQGNGRS